MSSSPGVHVKKNGFVDSCLFSQGQEGKKLSHPWDSQAGQANLIIKPV